MNPWQVVTFDNQEWFRWEVGPLTLWGRNVADEFHLAVEQIEETEEVEARPLPAIPGEALEVRRWILRNEPLAVRLLPVMPNRPVVVRPESPIRFPPGRSAMIYVSIPVYVRVMAEQSDSITLTEEPTRRLSNIWFGDPMDGALAYSLKSRGRRDLSTVVPQVHRALCPVKIFNRSEEELDFQRLCIHVEHLAVYRSGEHLWTTAVSVNFRGQNDVSRVDYGKSAPEDAPGAVLLVKAREPIQHSLFRRSFTNFVKWTGVAGGE